MLKLYSDSPQAYRGTEKAFVQIKLYKLHFDLGLSRFDTACYFPKDSNDLKEENCVDNFAAKLTNRDLCLYDLNVTLRIPLFNMIPLGILFSYCASFTKSYNVIVYMNTKFCIIYMCNTYMIYSLINCNTFHYPLTVHLIYTR